MKIHNSILRDHGSNGGGDSGRSGMNETDQFECFSIASAHRRTDLYERAMRERLSLREFQAILLREISTENNPNPRTQVANRSGGIGDTLGDRFLDNESFRHFAGGKGQRGCTFTVPWKTRATLTTATGLTSYTRPPGISLIDQQPLQIADLFQQIPVSASTVRATVEGSFTNAATSVAEEGAKPEASFDLNESDFNVRKIAVVGRFSDEILTDHPAVRVYANQRLAYMVSSKLDSHLLNGSGLSDQITGVFSTSGIQTTAFGAHPTAFDAVGKAVGLCWSGSYQRPDALVLHPTDYMNLRLTKDSLGHYLLGDPNESQAVVVGEGMVAVASCWGLPVVVSTAISQGTGLVAAFRSCGFLAMREGLRVEMTNSDASDFQYNRVCIRAELRAALVITKPTCFVKITGIPA